MLDSGSNNTALGYYACKYVTGSNKTCIGAKSGPASAEAGSSNSDEIIYLGSPSATVYIPGRLVVGRQAYIGDSLQDDQSLFLGMRHNDDSSKKMRRIYMRGDVGGKNNNNNLYGDGVEYSSPMFSDRRLKNVGKEFTSGLDKIRELKVFNYTFKKDEKKIPHVGVMAQDLQKIFPDAVKKGADGFLSIRMEDMFFAMVNAIKELDLKYQAQEKRINDLEKQLKQQDKRLKQLEAKIK